MLFFDFNKFVVLIKLNIGYLLNDSDMVVVGFNIFLIYNSSLIWSLFVSVIIVGIYVVFEIIYNGVIIGWNSFNIGGFEF